MQITTVHYQKLVNLGNFENERVGAWSNVAEGQDPAEVLAEVKAWVDKQVGQDEERRELKSSVASLRNRRDQLAYDVERLESNLRRAQEVWQVVSDFLIEHGVKELDAMPGLPRLEPPRPEPVDELEPTAADDESESSDDEDEDDDE